MAAIGFLVAALSLIGGAVTAVHTPGAVFDVASIKPNRSNAPEHFRALPGGRYEWTNVSVTGLIWQAYQRFDWDEREVTGAPDWARDDRYDVIVQLDPSAPVPETQGFPSALLGRIRAVLEDRFQLRTHWETREGPVYLLTLARPGMLGPGLTRVDVTCPSAMSQMIVAARGDQKPRGPACTFLLTSIHGELRGQAVTMDMLAQMLSGEDLERTVIDRTGLSGRFDVNLRYLPQVLADRNQPAPVGDAPPITTALREQLGLKVTAARAPIDVQVIDHIERPTEN
jgi:uncharacterized protein (TIGR03435 family)